MSDALNPVYAQSIERTLGEAKDVIERSFETNLIAMLWGASGIGKTEMIESLIANRKGSMQITLSLGSRDPLDFTGVPSILQGRTITNDPILVPLAQDRLPTDPEGNRYTEVVVYVDELPEGDIPTLKAIYRLLNERMVNNSKVHPAVRFVASGNNAAAGAFTEKLLPTVANRMMHILIRTCYKEWIAWATSKGVSPVQRAYIASSPGMLNTYDEKSEEDAFATPRTHYNLHKYMNGDLFTDKTLIAQGAPIQFLGQTAGGGLLSYAEATDLPPIDTILNDPEGFDIVSLRPGSTFLLGQSLISAARGHNIEAVLKVMGRMEDNHKAINFMGLQSLPALQQAELIANPIYPKFVSDNFHLLDIIRQVN